MTKQELIEDLRKMPTDKLHELLQCVQQEIGHRRSPTEADIALAYKYRNYPSPNPPAGFDLDDHDDYWF